MLRLRGDHMKQEFVRVVHVCSGRGIEQVAASIAARRGLTGGAPLVLFVDEYFEASAMARSCGCQTDDLVLSVATDSEPTTDGVDAYAAHVKDSLPAEPCAVVGIGGGITLDTAKAVSNLLTNPGRAQDYQGWDLVRSPGVYKIGVPTIAGTGAESSRTCVLTNTSTHVKLGMNSGYTLFDEVIIDSRLSATVPATQYFYTGMDTFLHCIETLAGRFRNPFSDTFSTQALAGTRTVFSSGDMQASENRETLCLASFLGGVAIAGSFVGIIHPVSAAISSILGTHHCEANCIAMRGMRDFYPAEYEEFWAFADMNGVEVGTINGHQLSDEIIAKMRDSMLVHDRPLSNALGDDFRSILTDDRIEGIFRAL